MQEIPHIASEHSLMENPCGKHLECCGALCSLSPELTQLMGRNKNLSPKNTLSAFPGAAPRRGLLACSCCSFSHWQLWESFYFREEQALQFPSPSSCPVPACCLLSPWWVSVAPETSSEIETQIKRLFIFFQVNPYLLKIGLVSSNPQVLHERSNEWMGKER